MLDEVADAPDGDSLAETLSERVSKVVVCGVLGAIPPPRLSAQIVR